MALHLGWIALLVYGSALWIGDIQNPANFAAEVSQAEIVAEFCVNIFITLLTVIGLMLIYLKKAIGWWLSLVGLLMDLGFSIYSIVKYREIYFSSFSFYKGMDWMGFAESAGLYLLMVTPFFVIPIVMLWLMWYLRKQGVFKFKAT